MSVVTNIAGVPGRFEIGTVISITFDVIGKNLVTFFMLSLLLSLPNLIFTFYSVLVTYFGLHAPALTTPGNTAAIFTGAAIGFIIYFVFTNLLQAAIAHGTLVSLNGGRASFADCFSTGIRNAIPLTGIVLLAGLGIMAGMVLLVVPGIIVALMWSVIMPVRVAEQTSMMETFSRSTSLTGGYKASIFGIFAIFFVLSIIVDFSIRPLAGLSFIGTGGSPNAMIIFVVLSGVARAILGLISATGVASIYYELRHVKEGVGPEQVAAIFS